MGVLVPRHGGDGGGLKPVSDFRGPPPTWETKPNTHEAQGASDPVSPGPVCGRGTVAVTFREEEELCARVGGGAELGSEG